ncbi:hypothetical protein HFP89_00625 [Wenzhouxiangella sp. XN79A]|uniref:YkgJ family cysteine cluster protein n=1 Tax=Wenzhouxiangella sp. XN79A TaxID=2724193 RepID=UPI00144AE70C|nr:YkgJ family cysteine cluster protein [Wenzhouxiangella sp. XN79A]NKI33668.1 hypothetical protein [Wenzhouxiangella sp. XN79A]
MSRLDALRIRAAEAGREAGSRGLRTSASNALRGTQRALEAELAALPRADRGPVACRSGCAFCCHLRVMATPVEVFALLDFLEQRLDAEAFESFVERVHRTESRLRALPVDKVLTVNLPCPALVDGRCSGYAGRPLNCRAYHSLSVDACRDSYDHPEDLHLGHPQLAPLARVHAGVQAGLVAALSEAGRDARQYELVSALAEALDDPTTRERLAAGERVFRQALTLDDPTDESIKTGTPR